MNYVEGYYSAVKNLLDKLYTKKDDIEKAAGIIADAAKNNRLIHIVGTEMHSSMAAEDVFYREGSLVNINPLFDPTFSVTHSASRSLYLKESEGCGQFVIEYYRNINKGDVLIIVDNDGTGRACLEAVKEAKEKGLRIIAVTSSEFAKSIDKDCWVRNEDKINLCDMDGIEVVIDNEVPAFDSVVELDGSGKKTGWVSTIANSFIMNMVLLESLKLLENQKAEVDVWHNFYDADEMSKNEKLIEKYYDRIKHI